VERVVELNSRSRIKTHQQELIPSFVLLLQPADDDDDEEDEDEDEEEEDRPRDSRGNKRVSPIEPREGKGLRLLELTLSPFPPLSGSVEG